MGGSTFSAGMRSSASQIYPFLPHAIRQTIFPLLMTNISGVNIFHISSHALGTEFPDIPWMSVAGRALVADAAMEAKSLSHCAVSSRRTCLLEMYPLNTAILC